MSRFLVSSLLAFCMGAGIFAAEPLPAGAVARFGSPRLQDFTIDRSATFSPDGKLIATSGANSPICVWEVATGKRIRTHPVRGSVFDLRWKPDGKLSAVTFFGHDSFLMQEFAADQKPDANEEAKIDEEARNRERRTEKAPAKKDRLNYVFLSTDGRTVVAAWHDPGNTLQRVALYKFKPAVSSATATAENTITLPFTQPFGCRVWLSLDGKFLLACVSATKEQAYKIVAFDLTAAKDRNKPAWEFVPPGGDQRRPDTCLSADGKRVVVLFADASVELWDGPADKRIRELPKLPVYYHHSNGEWRGMDLTADGKRLSLIHRNASGEMGGRIVDVDTGKDVCKLAPQPMPRLGGVSRFSADGKHVAQVGYGVVRIWDAETGADACPLPGHRGAVTSFVITPDGKRIVSAGADLNVRAWEPATGKEVWRTPFPQAVKVKLVTPDAVIVQEDRWGETGPALLIDPATGKTHPLPGKLGEAKEDVVIAVSPDGKSVVSIGPKRNDFQVWSWPGGELRKRVLLQPPGNLVLSRCVASAFGPEGTQFVAVMHYANPEEQMQRQRVPDHPVVERWDLNAGKLLERVEKEAFTSAVLIPSRSRLLLQEKTQLRNAISQEVIATLSFPEGHTRDLRWLAGVALSPDRRTLAVLESSSEGVMLYEMYTGRLRATLPREGRYQSGLGFLPDGRLVTTGDTALVWDVGLSRGGALLSERELAACWASLRDSNPTQAWPAMTKLAGSGAVAFIRKRLPSVSKVSEAELDRIVRQLDADKFKDREAASRELDALGMGAVSRVQARLKKGVSEEVKKRVEQFLARYSRTGLDSEEMRALRAVQVLEAIGTSEAKELLGELARGDETARLTGEAAESIRRAR